MSLGPSMVALLVVTLSARFDVSLPELCGIYADGNWAVRQSIIGDVDDMQLIGRGQGWAFITGLCMGSLLTN